MFEQFEETADVSTLGYGEEVIVADDFSEYKDSDLMGRFCDGDGNALNQLAEIYNKYAIRVATSVLRTSDLAEDVVQEAWIKAMNARDSFDRNRAFLPWFSRIVANTARDLIRSHSRKRNMSHRFCHTENGDMDHFSSPSAESPLPENIQAVLNSMPEIYRSVLWESVVLDYPTKNIAAEAGRDQSTIRWRLGEARKMFRERYQLIEGK